MTLTTGTLVFGYGGMDESTPCIYKDNGWYEGTKKECNVRKVEQIEIFEHLNCVEAKQALCGDTSSYGCRWGGGFSLLYPITNDGAIENLRQENLKQKALAEETEKSIRVVSAAKPSGICPKCGTWCYGDCEAN